MRGDRLRGRPRRQNPSEPGEPPRQNDRESPPGEDRATQNDTAEESASEQAIWFVTNDAHEIFLIHRHQGVWAEAA